MPSATQHAIPTTDDSIRGGRVRARTLSFSGYSLIKSTTLLYKSVQQCGIFELITCNKPGPITPYGWSCFTLQSGLDSAAVSMPMAPPADHTNALRRPIVRASWKVISRPWRVHFRAPQQCPIFSNANAISMTFNIQKAGATLISFIHWGKIDLLQH